MGGLPTPSEQNLDVDRRGPVRLAASLAQPISFRRRAAVSVEDRTGGMAAIEASPAEVLLAARSTSLDPAQASDDDDIAARWHERRCLLGRCPVEFEQK